MDAELEVISPPENATEFTVNGKVYRRSTSLSTQRYGWMRFLQQELEYGLDAVDAFKANKKAFELLNQQKFAEAAVLIHANMTGAAKIADRSPSAMIKLFCLFWNTEGEDKRIMTEDLMAEKVKDIEGLDISFVFRSAASSVPGLLAAYKLASLASSGAENQIQPSELTTA
jgi:hypothetical protein